jgi:hypothetical protein
MFSRQLKLCLFFISFSFSINVFAQTSVPAKIKKLNLYAGIDVGSKGVKLSIIQMGKNAAVTRSFTAIKDTAINTDFILFTPASFSATLKGLCNLYNLALTNYGIPAEKIYTVVSSGIKGQAEKENKNYLIKNLADSFKQYFFN